MSEIENWVGEVHQGNAKDVLQEMPENSVDCVITSPPYWNLRDYGVEDQLGAEDSYQDYIQKLVNICSLIKNVLKERGNFNLNLGDTYQNKNKMNIPHRVAIELQNDGWIERNDIVWEKLNPIPDTPNDRRANVFEYFFHFVKNKEYYYDLDSIREPYAEVSKERSKYSFKESNNYEVGNAESFSEDTVASGKGKNPGDIIKTATASYSDAHFATYPTDLIEPLVKSSCPEGGIVLDPFIGSGTTAIVCENLNRKWIGIDLNKDYVDMSYDRIGEESSKIFDDRSIFDY